MSSRAKRNLESGMVFGRWTVIDAGRPYSLCQCECGTRREVQACSLLSGRSSSCGCRQAIHGGAKRSSKTAAEYSCWAGLMNRCSDRVCIEWHDFLKFLEGIGHRPKGAKYICLLDRDGLYEPGNAFWSKRPHNSSLITIGGKARNITEWAEIAGVKKMTMYMRVRAGWPEERLLAPARGYQPKRSAA